MRGMKMRGLILRKHDIEDEFLPGDFFDDMYDE
jgi:hypothetical protein